MQMSPRRARKTLNKRAAHLNSRIVQASASKRVLSYDINERKSLCYAVNLIDVALELADDPYVPDYVKEKLLNAQMIDIYNDNPYAKDGE